MYVFPSWVRFPSSTSRFSTNLRLIVSKYTFIFIHITFDKWPNQWWALGGAFNPTFSFGANFHIWTKCPIIVVCDFLKLIAKFHHLTHSCEILSPQDCWAQYIHYFLINFWPQNVCPRPFLATGNPSLSRMDDKRKFQGCTHEFVAKKLIKL